MKRIFLIISILCLCNYIIANPIDKNIAQKVAINFLKHNASSSLTLTEEVTLQPEFPNLYIFKIADGHGFIIIAGDDNASPILAYSTENDFDIQNIAPEVREWLHGYSEAITWIHDTQFSNVSAQNSWQKALSGQFDSKEEELIPALIKTRWDQGKYYNALCPKASDKFPNENVYTGCVATAMAQILKYWNYPSHGRGSFSYSWENNPNAPYWTYGTLSADFENTYYDWQHMPEILFLRSSEQEKTAVATLMYHCGISVEMNYNCTNTRSSDACTMKDLLSDTNYNYMDHTYSAENALYTFWGYKTSIHGLYKDNYTDEEWLSLIRTELENGRPLIYRAEGSGGHCFILDGIDQYSKCHFNWGWGGSANGFYAINPLEAAGYNFNVKQSGIFGIEPDGTLSGIAEEPSVRATFSVHANAGELIIYSSQNENIRVYDALGRILYHATHSDLETHVPISTNGLYLVQVGRSTQKVMVSNY